jgi:hyperosmotically inducible protein
MKAPLAFLGACALLAACTRNPAADLAPVPSRSDTATVSAGTARPPVEPAPQPSRLLPPPEALTDPVITGKIKASILADPAMVGSDVSVGTSHGVVALTGVVASQEQMAIASAHAQGQDGVMRVDNHLSMPLK